MSDAPERTDGYQAKVIASTIQAHQIADDLDQTITPLEPFTPYATAIEAARSADTIKALVAEALEGAAKIANSWQSNGDILLKAGKMTGQELRTAKAVAGGIERAIRALTLFEIQAALELRIAEAERRGAEKEREACAKLAHNLIYEANPAGGYFSYEKPLYHRIATAIRNRGNDDG